MPRQPKSEKAKKTLEAMKEHRVEDTRNLRVDIEAKLKWALEQKENGIKVIEKQMKQIQENKNTLLELQGIIKVLTQLLEPIKEETNETSK
jgi:LDH2 family malate/lactate/ureidoglycolate dehydrogenase